MAHDTTNAAYKNRHPWRNTPGPRYITAAQTDLIRTLEEQTGTPSRDLTGWKRVEASDYITILQHRAKTRG